MLLPLPASFVKRVSRGDDGCWLWTGWTDKDGYARVGINHVRHGAHRLAYEAYVGPIPEGMEIDHLCHNRSCVNPMHLQVVTHIENIRRSVRVASGFCKRGHSLADAANYNGHRYCRTCQRLRKRVKQPSQQGSHDARPFICRNGHLRTVENTRIEKTGAHRCRICKRINDAKRRATAA